MKNKNLMMKCIIHNQFVNVEGPLGLKINFKIRDNYDNCLTDSEN